MEKKEKQEKKEKKGKKKSVVAKIFTVIFSVLLIIIAAILVWGIFSFCDRQPAISVLPSGASIYVHTDSAYDALNPLLDLQAADMLFSTKDFLPYRGTFMSVRQNPLRKNSLVKSALNRTVDISVYPSEDGTMNFVAAVDMGFLSAATRLLKPLFSVLQNFIKSDALFAISIDNTSRYADSNSDFWCFKYDDGSTVAYFKPIKNLVIATLNKGYLELAANCDNEKKYSDDAKKVLTEKSRDPIRVVADANRLAYAFMESIPTLDKISSIIEKDSLSVVSFKITDDEINMNANLPLEKTENVPSEFFGLSKILSNDSTVPNVLSEFSDITQYYTIVNAAPILELKDAATPLLDADINSLWKTGNQLSKTIFSSSLEEILGSWTGNEFSVLGVEGLNDPVFAVQVKDEKKRAEVFDKILSSIIFKDDTSLILNGVRLPRIALPYFLQNIVNAFGIDIPNPYYLVMNNYIYFSTSPETLSAIYNSQNSNKRIAKNENWKAVTKDKKTVSFLSLFYDLERSIPFFLRGESAFSKVLELYGIGRCDIRSQNNSVEFSLNAVSRRRAGQYAISGFPISLNGRTDFNLQVEGGKKPQNVFWIEDGKTINSLDVTSLRTLSYEMPSKTEILASEKTYSNGGVLWAVTGNGQVYLFTKSLEVVDGYPVVIGIVPAAKQALTPSGIVVPLADGSLCFVSAAGELCEINPNLTGSIKSAPEVFENLVAIYDKSFLGRILIFENTAEIETDTPKQISGIAFGSPSIMKKGKNIFVAFITQAGNLSIWKNGELITDEPIKLSGVFYTNVVNNGKDFFAVSSSGQLYKIDVAGGATSVVIPRVNAKEAVLTVHDEKIFVGVDGNIIYGFNSNLELLPGFPIAACGRPVFADANGDGFADCIALTIDKKINAWNLR